MLCDCVAGVIGCCHFCLKCETCRCRCWCMGSMSVRSCICRMFVSGVHHMEVFNATF